jgi:hypothetical protein
MRRTILVHKPTPFFNFVEKLDMQRIISISILALAGFALSACDSDSGASSGAAFGSACNSSAECASGVCLPETNLCTQRCDQAAMDCPVNYTCEGRNNNAVFICSPEDMGAGGAGGGTMQSVADAC